MSQLSTMKGKLLIYVFGALVDKNLTQLFGVYYSSKLLLQVKDLRAS